MAAIRNEILLFSDIILINTLVVVGMDIHNDYNYDLLLSDYNLSEVTEASNITCEGSIINDNAKNIFSETFLKKITPNIKYKCTDEEINHIDMKSIICLFINITKPNHPSNFIFKRLWRVLQIWMFIYLIAALPLWFTKGWCCCCFYCKFVKPDKTIEEAKKYLALNPPGILIDRGSVICYEPTVYEKECYERFEHLIRTI